MSWLRGLMRLKARAPAAFRLDRRAVRPGSTICKACWCGIEPAWARWTTCCQAASSPWNLRRAAGGAVDALQFDPGGPVFATSAIEHAPAFREGLSIRRGSRTRLALLTRQAIQGRCGRRAGASAPVKRGTRTWRQLRSEEGETSGGVLTAPAVLFPLLPAGRQTGCRHQDRRRRSPPRCCHPRQPSPAHGAGSTAHRRTPGPRAFLVSRKVSVPL